MEISAGKGWGDRQGALLRMLRRKGLKGEGRTLQKKLSSGKGNIEIRVSRTFMIRLTSLRGALYAVLFKVMLIAASTQGGLRATPSDYEETGIKEIMTTLPPPLGQRGKGGGRVVLQIRFVI